MSVQSQLRYSRTRYHMTVHLHIALGLLHIALALLNLSYLTSDAFNKSPAVPELLLTVQYETLLGSVTSRDHTASRAVSVTGISCRTAGAANSQQLWRLLLAGGCALTSDPPHRWRRVCVGAAEAVLSGGFLSMAEYQFDAQQWGFTKSQSQRLDVHLTMLIDTMCGAVCDAGLSASVPATDGTHIGVFSGCSTAEFLQSTPSYFVARTAASALKVAAALRHTADPRATGEWTTRQLRSSLQQQLSRSPPCSGQVCTRAVTS